MIGFVGSVIVAVSLTMSSIVKLRWYNLLGASIFSVYGFLIGSMPVAFLNLFITLTDIYYLIAIYSKKEYFKALMVRPDNYYLEFFLDYYKDEIVKFFPDFPKQKYILKKETERPFALIILRDAAVAGVVLGKRNQKNELFVLVDFVIPQYRDMKPGKFLFQKNLGFFREHGFDSIATIPKNKEHYQYLKKIGFKEESRANGDIYLVKQVST